MKNWFLMGGPLFMSILTIVFVITVALSIYFAVQLLNKKALDRENFSHQLKYLKSLGLFTVICGFLGQMVGLYAAFEAIEGAMDISPAIMAGGLKVSLITPLTGMVFYLLSIILWFGLDIWHSKLTNGAA